MTDPYKDSDHPPEEEEQAGGDWKEDLEKNRKASGEEKAKEEEDSEPREEEEGEKEEDGEENIRDLEGRMPLLEHLAELRSRLFVSFATIIVGFMVAFYFSEQLFSFLTLPMRADLKFLASWPFITAVPSEGGIEKLVFLSPAENLWMHLKIAFVAAVIASVPVLMIEAWRFLSPGLLPHERKYASPFVISASGLFFLGSAFCFGVVLPFAVKFLLGYKTETVEPMISVGNYVDFCLKFILAFGVVFELPIIIVFLTRLGLVTPATLARHRKYAILGAFIIAAVLTPTPDAFNQLLMAVPIIVLYEVGIIVSKIFVKRGSAEGA